MTKHRERDLFFMGYAYRQAREALANGEVPIGCVIVMEEQIIGGAYNQTELLSDGTAHAEMIAITQACGKFRSKFLERATLYCTIEPCVMCFGAILNAHIGRVVYGACEPKTGFSKLVSVVPKHVVVEGGVMEEACRGLMVDFFKGKR